METEMQKQAMIQCDNLVKIYKTKDIEVLALQGLDMRVDQGELMAIIGNSGSGKSTFLNMIGGLDRPSAGRLIVDGKDLFKLSEKELVAYKRSTVGFVWQNNARNLLPYLTALQNVQVPMMFDSVARPYVLAYGDVFSTLPSCGVGGPMAQAAEAEKILSCNPDIVISEFEDVEKSDALQQQLGVPVITLGAGTDGVFDAKFAGSMTLLGKIFAREDKAAQLVKFVADERAAIEARVANIPEADKPSVYICGLGNWGNTDHLMTAEKYVSFEIANVKNVLCYRKRAVNIVRNHYNGSALSIYTANQFVEICRFAGIEPACGFI